MDKIDELRSQVPKRCLYHYTDWGGVTGISKNGNLRATDILFLDDTSEYQFAVDLLRKEARKIWDSLRKYWGVDEFLTMHFLPQLNKVPGKEAAGIYVCSFSSLMDDHIAWSCYGRRGRGYSIGFDYADLIEPLRTQGFWLVPCQYRKKVQTQIIHDFLRRVVEIFHQTSNAFPPTERGRRQAAIDAAPKAFEEFLQVAPMLKNSKWTADGEWRLISKPMQRTVLSRPYRPPEGSNVFGQGIIPYIEFDLKTEDKPFRIREIVIGRGLDPKTAIMNFQSGLLPDDVFKGCSIKVSKVPYRPYVADDHEFFRD